MINGVMMEICISQIDLYTDPDNSFVDKFVEERKVF